MFSIRPFVGLPPSGWGEYIGRLVRFIIWALLVGVCEYHQNSAKEEEQGVIGAEWKRYCRPEFSMLGRISPPAVRPSKLHRLGSRPRLRLDCPAAVDPFELRMSSLRAVLAAFHPEDSVDPPDNRQANHQQTLDHPIAPSLADDSHSTPNVLQKPGQGGLSSFVPQVGLGVLVSLPLQ